MAEGASTRRKKTEMLELDKRIRPWYEKGLGCRQIGTLLGEDPAIIYKRVRRMKVVRSRQEALQVAPELPLPFQAQVSEKFLRTAAIGEAVSWFLHRGYVVSVPLAVTQYDLIAESDTGFVKVQVKTTTSKTQYGRWEVGIERQIYDAEAGGGANGSRRRRAYRPDEIDMFFITTSDGSRYLIPLEATGGATSLTLDNKYAAYKV